MKTVWWLIILVGVLIIALSSYFFLNTKLAEQRNINLTPIPTNTNSSERPTTFNAKTEQLAYNYFKYSKEGFDNAKDDKRPILLYFYANWCVPCQNQDANFISMMNNLQGADRQIVAFRVSYKDPETTKEETEITEDLKVTIQHTIMVLDRTGLLRSKFIGDTPTDQILTQLRSEM